MDILRLSVQKRLNRSRCRLGCELGLAQEILCWMGSRGAEGPCHGNHFWLSMGYKFGCMIASDTLFDSRGGFSGSSYPMKT